MYLVGKLGSGVARMVIACQMLGVPEPYYEVRPGGIAIIFRRKTEYVNTDGESDGESGGEIQLSERQQDIIDFIRVDGESGGETGGEIQLSERQQDIVDFIRVDGDTTVTEMAKLLGISKCTIDREISFLRKNGYIRKETKDNRSPWVVIRDS